MLVLWALESSEVSETGIATEVSEGHHRVSSRPLAAKSAVLNELKGEIEVRTLTIGHSMLYRALYCIPHADMLIKSPMQLQMDHLKT